MCCGAFYSKNMCCGAFYSKNMCCGAFYSKNMCCTIFRCKNMCSTVFHCKNMRCTVFHCKNMWLYCLLYSLCLNQHHYNSYRVAPTSVTTSHHLGAAKVENKLKQLFRCTALSSNDTKSNKHLH